MSERPAPSPERIEAANEHERQPLDFTELAAGDIDILMLGEDHFHTALFDTIAQNASALHTAGIRALLTETGSDQDFSNVNAGDFSRLDSGDLEAGPPLRLVDPTTYRQLDGTDPLKDARNRMVKALVAQGINIVPVDSVRHHAELEARFGDRSANSLLPEPGLTQAEREVENRCCYRPLWQSSATHRPLTHQKRRTDKHTQPTVHRDSSKCH
jgi:hypothetical protein